MKKMVLICVSLLAFNLNAYYNETRSKQCAGVHPAFFAIIAMMIWPFMPGAAEVLANRD